MVVDSDPTFRRLVKSILEPLGVTVEEAVNGQEAIGMFDSYTWDVVLMDPDLPDMDGFRVLGLMRIKFPLEELPVIVTTVDHEVDTRIRALRLGANDFISKPVDLTELLARIGNLLVVRWAHRNLEDQVKKDEEMRSFRDLVISTFVHDQRNALAGAKSYTEMVLEGMSDTEAPAASRLGKVVEAIDRSVEMTADVLDVSGLEEGKLKPMLEDFGVGEMARFRVAALQPLALRNRISVETDVAPDLPAVKADHRMLERSLENLLAAALRNTPEGGRIVVSVRKGGKGDLIALRVAHTGWRPAMALPLTIFDERFQAELKRLGYDTGTGLGLNYCRLAVKSHHGMLAFKAGPGMDAEFTLSIPVISIPV
jgi:signal transduction histidine kinase